LQKTQEKSKTPANEHIQAIGEQPMNRSRAGTGAGIALMVGVCLSSTLLASSGSTWKWHDADGNITYGDSPPRGIAAEQVRVSTGTRASTPHAPSEQPSAAANTKSNADSKQQVATSNSITPQRAQALCAQATTNLEILQSSAMVRQIDDSGEERILDDTEKQAQIETARDIISYHCH
jgi:hypothetical protein